MHRLGKIICCAVLCVPLIAAVIIGVTNKNDVVHKNDIVATPDNDYLVKVKIHSENGDLINEYDSPEVLQD